MSHSNYVPLKTNSTSHFLHHKLFFYIEDMVQTVVDSLFHSFGSTESCGFMVKEQLANVVQEATDPAQTVNNKHQLGQ
jgi:hypothetical protein